jgi:chromosome segregation ATPase
MLFCRNLRNRLDDLKAKMKSLSEQEVKSDAKIQSLSESREKLEVRVDSTSKLLVDCLGKAEDALKLAEEAKEALGKLDTANASIYRLELYLKGVVEAQTEALKALTS